MMNRKGQTTLLIAILLIGLFFGSILLLVTGLVSTKMNSALDQNITVGQINLAEENAKTFGKFNEMVLINADWWGLCLIFGMILGLFLSSYFLRNRFPKWGIVLDIFIILTMFMASLYISSTYQILLNALESAGETFLEDYATKTSIFILNLPVFVVIIGVSMMILFHSSIPRRTEERIQQGGILQGV